MARPTNGSNKLLQNLADKIRAELDSLVEQYDVRLADRPGYNRLPAPMRRDLERQLLNLIADALIQGNSRELVEHVRQRAVQWAAAGLEIAWFQASLTVPEEILVPLIDSVEASTFLWQALNRSHDTVWQIVAERAHQAEQTLRQSQQLLQTVMDNIPQAVFWKDQNLTYLGCNRAFAEDAGLASPGEIVGKTDLDMPWQTQADLYRADDRAVIDSGTAKINYEEPQTTSTGQQTWLRTSKVPMLDATGHVTAVLGMYEDITERKHTEDALAQERNLLRTLIDNLPDQVFFKDAAGRIILYNEADARAMGITSTEEAVGKTVYDLYPRELADLYHADDMAVIQSDQPLINREEPGLDKAGQPRWILTTKIPLKDAQGNRLGLVGMARDITARRKIELSLQQSEERFRRLTEATVEGLVFHDQGVILDANPAVVAQFGFTAASDMIGHSILEVIVPECRPLVMQKMQLGDVSPYEIECIRHDGSIFPVETATRTYQYEGRTVRASSIRDITRRKQLEQSIHESFERRGHEVEVSRQVAQEIATATDVDDIFPLVVKLIKERFDYYHAQIFRYDAVQDAVVLVAGYGAAGSQMLAAGHQLSMGRGIVGTATQTGESILVADSRHDEDWRPNPNLPDTKGEVAVPIKFQDEILGILDVQSDRVNALTQDDVLLLEGLAGQIAVAIANTRTLEEANTFRSLVEAAGQGIAFAAPDGRLTFVNAAVARMFGLPDVTHIVGQHVIDFYSETERMRVQAAAAQAIERGQWTGELVVQPINGSAPVSTINSIFTVKDRKGNLRHIANIITDITERKHVEQRLAEAIRLARMGYWTYDVSTDQFIFNDQFYALMRTTVEREGGYTMSSGQYTQRFVHPDDAPLVGLKIGEALTTTDPNYRGEVSHRVYFGDGELGYVTVRFTIEQDEHGRTIRTGGANQDITDIRLAEEELRASESQLSQALHIAKLAYWEYDAEKDLFLFNDQFFSIFHTTAQEHGGYRLSSGYYAQHFVHPDDLAIVGAEIEKALNSTDQHYSRSLEHRIIYTDGGLGYISVNINIDRDAQGRILRYYGANQDITERKLAEQALARSADLLKTIFENSRDLIYIKDRDSRFQIASQAVVNLIGASSPAEVIGKNDFDFFPAALAQKYFTDEQQIMDSGEPLLDVEEESSYPDGTGIWLLTTKIPFRSADGKVDGVVGIGRDITERKLAEEAIRRSEAQLTEALRIAQLADWSYDVPTDTFTFNDQFYALMHTSVDREGGYTMSSTHYTQRFVHPDDAALVGIEIGKALTTTDPNYRGEVSHRVYFGDGEPGYVTVRFTIEQDEHGRTIRTNGANQDITARKRAEEEIQRSEQLMRTVIDSTPDWIFIKDQEHRYRLANQGYANSLHIPVDNFIGKDDLELGFPEDLVKGNPEQGLAGFWADDRAVMDSGQPKVIPNDIVSIDGARHIYNTIKTPLRDAAGKVWAVLAFARDITEREQLLQDVQRRANQIEAVAEVGAASAALLEPQALLESIVRLTRRRFDLYHCHIFLMDEAGQTLKVQACGWRDPEDENRPASDHVIRADAVQSLVARAARTRKPVIINDVRAEPGWLPNPQLPDVQSEMALPMVVGDKVLGVFNAHADERDHFTDDDAQAMTTLATQTAIALQNARLFAQTQRTAEELDLLNRRLTGEAWETYLQRKTREHVILAKSNNPAAPDALPMLNESLAAGQVVVEQAADQPAQTITTPIVLRGQTVGVLRVQADREGWSEDVQSVLTSIASHIAQAAENTRLLEESETRFARERALAEATDKVRRRTEVDQILETAAAELAHYLQASAVKVQVGTSDQGRA